MPSNSKSSLGLKLAALGTLLFLHVPLLIIFIYALQRMRQLILFRYPVLRQNGLALLWDELTFGRH
jgi:putative spermidine/putrescine transport system permease protein